MSTFQIQNIDKTFKAVNHKEFYDTLNSESGYLYYKQGGTHLALLPTNENLETIRTCRQAENAENYTFATASRCLDEKGHLCRYQHNANGSIIRSVDGKPICAKCGDCPRDGWTAGKRENCCIRNYCKILDCTFCPNPREYRVPLSLDRFADDNLDGNELDDVGYVVADPDTDIQTALETDELFSALHIAVNQLPLDEQAVILAIFWDKLSYRAYAEKSGLSKSTVNRIYNRTLQSLKNILKDFQ